MNRSVEFFDAQFRHQIASRDFKLNPFETRALDFLTGTVLDLGCGLGNLTLEAARRGHDVCAVDSSAAAIARIEEVARLERLSVRAWAADFSRWKIGNSYSTIVCIGVLMFLPRGRSLELLREIQECVEPGGRAIINVLVEGTTFLDMFQPDGYYLYGRDEMEELFAGWTILSSDHASYPAPDDKRKEFATVIAAKG